MRLSPKILVAATAVCALPVLLALLIQPGTTEPSWWVSFFGRTHTLALHLPIGVLLLIAAAEGLSLVPTLRKRIDPALGFAWLFFIATALTAFTLGLMLAKGGGYPAKLVALHRGFTLGSIVVSVIASLTWFLRIRADGTELRAPYRVALGIALGLLTFGAHQGGSMTHGEGYLLAYAPDGLKRLAGHPVTSTAGTDVPVPITAEPLVFANLIKPVLQAKCVLCHGAEKSKGRLRLDSLDAMVKGGEHGKAIDAGHGGTSLLIARMSLPVDHDEAMPPEGKPRVTPEEMQLIRWWIDRGASASLTVREALPPEGARGLLSTAVANSFAPPTKALEVAAPMSTTIAPVPSSTSAALTQAPSLQSIPTTHAVAMDPAHVTWAQAGPLLLRACGSCHTGAKQKGHLRVDSIDALIIGGKHGAAIVAGDVARGTLLARVHLPLADEEHMPPREEPQLSSSEVALLTAWIAQGAQGPKAVVAPNSIKTPSVVPSRFASSTSSSPAEVHSLMTPANSLIPVASSAPVIQVEPAAAHEESATSVSLYASVVAPILKARCGECHQGAKVSAGLHVDDRKGMIASGTILPGKADDSPLLTRMLTNSDAWEHMPPSDKPQPSRGEIAAVRAWIAGGAGEELRAPLASVPNDVQQLVGLSSTGAAASTASPTPAPSSANSVPNPAQSAGEASSHDSMHPASMPPPVHSACGACHIGEAADRTWDGLFALGSMVAMAFAIRRRRLV